MKSDQFAYIMELAMKEQYDFPQIIKRGLMRVVMEVGVATQRTDDNQNYWSQTIESLYNRLKRLLSSDDFVSSHHQEQIKIQITDLLECFIGECHFALNDI